MCLALSAGATPKIAEEDIIVYKRLRFYGNCRVDISKINDGDNFIGVVNNVECSGKIHKTTSDDIYLCCNKKAVDGMKSPNKFRYRYSWILDRNVTSLIVNDIELITNTECVTPYRYAEIEIGHTYTSNLLKNKYNDITVGLHSFESLKNAKADGSGVYAKCIIPKGAIYYKGKFGEYNSYASNTLKYIEIIK